MNTSIVSDDQLCQFGAEVHPFGDLFLHLSLNFSSELIRLIVREDFVTFVVVKASAICRPIFILFGDFQTLSRCCQVLKKCKC